MSGDCISAGRKAGASSRRDRPRQSRAVSRSPSRGRSRSRSRDRVHSGRRGRGGSRSRSRSPGRGSRPGGDGERKRSVAEPEPNLEQINKCRVPRDYLERCANEPSFEKAVKGCFVRVMRGMGDDGERVYVMAEIVGVVPYKRRYKVGNAYTTKCLRVLCDREQEQNQCMDVVSNSCITKTEYQRWRAGRMSVGAHAPTEAECKARHASMHSFVLEHETSTEKKTTTTLGDGRAPPNVALSRIKLSNALEVALAQGKQDDADELRQRLAKLDEFESQTKKVMCRGAAGMKLLNQRNRAINAQVDAHVGRAKRLQGQKRRMESAAGNAVVVDPYKRRDCRPKILWSVGGTDSRQAGAAASGADDSGSPDQSASNAAESSARTLDGAGSAGTDGTHTVSRPDPPALPRLHGFGGDDILEAGKAALEAWLAARQAPEAQRSQRASGELSHGTCLGKARLPRVAVEPPK